MTSKFNVALLQVQIQKRSPLFLCCGDLRTMILILDYIGIQCLTFYINTFWFVSGSDGARGTGIGEKDPGSNFFLRPPSAGLTNHVIRHMS